LIIWIEFAATMDRAEKLTENIRAKTHFSNLNVDARMMLK
jgi:hypothetical protein